MNALVAERKKEKNKAVTAIAATVQSSPAQKAVVEWIHDILDEKDWTGTTLAHKAELAPSTVLRIINDPNHRFTPSLKTLHKIAHAAGMSVPGDVVNWMRNEAHAEIMDQQSRAEAFVSQATETTTPSADAMDVMSEWNDDDDRLPVKYVYSLPKSLHHIYRKTVMVDRPSQLKGDETAFAFYLPDSGMEPFFAPGSLAYATKRRDVVKDDIVLLTRKNGCSMVRVLTRIDEDGLTVKTCGKSAETVPYDDVEDISVVAVLSKV